MGAGLDICLVMESGQGSDAPEFTKTESSRNRL